MTLEAEHDQQEILLGEDPADFLISNSVQRGDVQLYDAQNDRYLGYFSVDVNTVEFKSITGHFVSLGSGKHIVDQSQLPVGFFPQSVRNLAFEIDVEDVGESAEDIWVSIKTVPHNQQEMKIVLPEVIKNKVKIETSFMLAGGAEGQIQTPDGVCYGVTARKIGKGEGENEDSVMVKKGMVAVADGMGGKKNGAKTSKEALRHLYYFQPNANSEYLLKNIEDSLYFSGIGEGRTTLAVIRRRYDQEDVNEICLEGLHAGDSKIYIASFSKKDFLYVSKDQSKVQKLYDSGELTDPLDRYHHPQSNLVSNSLSASGKSFEPGIGMVKGVPGDLIGVVASDGVSKYVSPEEILNLMLQYRNLCGPEIVKLARSRHRQADGFDIMLDGQQRTVPVNPGSNDSGSDDVSVALIMG